LDLCPFKGRLFTKYTKEKKFTMLITMEIRHVLKNTEGFLILDTYHQSSIIKKRKQKHMLPYFRSINHYCSNNRLSKRVLILNLVSETHSGAWGKECSGISLQSTVPVLTTELPGSGIRSTGTLCLEKCQIRF
jgi:hypothetical protein